MSNVETKVKVGTVASYLGSAAVLAVIGASQNSEVLSGLPDWLTAILIPLLPALATGAAAYKAKHTPRPDLDTEETHGRHAAS